MPFKVVLPQPPQRASLFILYSGGSTLPLIYENRNWVLLGHIPDYPRNSSFEGYPSPINILIYYYSIINKNSGYTFAMGHLRQNVHSGHPLLYVIQILRCPSTHRSVPPIHVFSDHRLAHRVCHTKPHNNLRLPYRILR